MTRNQPPPFDTSARRVRFSLRYPRPGEPSENDPGFKFDIMLPDDPEHRPVFVTPNARHLAVAEPQSKEEAIGKCIYCGAMEFTPGSGERLSDEHIIPEGLGARLVLEEASCNSCALKINKYETGILKDLLGASRRSLALRRKRRQRHPEEETRAHITKVFVGANMVARYSVPPDIYPTMLVLVVLDAPGLLNGRAKNASGLFGLVAHALRTPDTLAATGLRHFEVAEFDTVYFCRLLAKIAHGFAVAKLGINGFRPLLLQAICPDSRGDDDWDSRYHWIGGDPTRFAPSEAQHILGWRIHIVGRERLIVVSVRLFANLGMPVYDVVIGELTPPQLVRALDIEAAEKRLMYGV